MAKEDDFYDDIEDWEDDDEFEEWMRQEEEDPTSRGCAPAVDRGILFFAALALLFRWLEHIN